jgi:hypothetical protein
VLSGELSCGLIVDHYALLDYFQMSQLIHYAIPQNLKLKVFVTLLSEKNIRKPNYLNKLFDFQTDLTRYLGDVRKLSPLRRFKRPRVILTDPQSISGDFFCYFYESIKNIDGQNESRWFHEVVKLEFRKKNTQGGHRYRLDEQSKLFNERLEFFELQGGIIGDYLFYFIANYNDELTTSDWPHAKRFYDQLKESQRVSEHEKKDDSFLAIMPYYEQKKVEEDEQHLWWGFWLGMDELTHPLANGMAISSKKLDAEELEEIREKIRICSMYAGAGTSGQFINRSTKE